MYFAREALCLLPARSDKAQSVPAGRLYGPSSSARAAQRPTRYAGGRTRSTSSTTASRYCRPPTLAALGGSPPSWASISSTARACEGLATFQNAHHVTTVRHQSAARLQGWLRLGAPRPAGQQCLQQCVDLVERAVSSVAYQGHPMQAHPFLNAPTPLLNAPAPNP